MSGRKTPSWLHDVLGERFEALELVAILAVGAAAATLMLLALPLPGLSTWRLVFASLIAADIAAGCVANFTRGTNEYYAARPAKRWLFIAVHVHLPVLAWVARAEVAPALVVWAYTIAAAALVNALAGRPAQRVTAGLCLTVALMGLPLCGIAPPLMAIYLLFVAKVVYAFAVDHEAPGAELYQAEASEIIRPLSHRDRSAATFVLASAFARDPLFVAVLGADSADEAGRVRGQTSRRAALCGYLLDMQRLLGGHTRGLFIDGRLVGVSLVDAPLRQGRHYALATGLRLIAAALRFLPLGFQLGTRASRLLNDYVRLTRAAAPRTPHHYLAMVGVRPGIQGRGLGRKLVEDAMTLVLAEPRSSGLALDTENRENVTLYSRWGFAETAAIDLNGVHAWSMFRPKS